MADIRVGIIGWNYPEWKGLVYPPNAKPGDFLRHYAQRFRVVEAATSQYGMPKTEVVARWAAETPDDFEMSLKVPDWIVRTKPSDPDLPRAMGVLLAHMAPLQEAGKLGALVAQFHPSYRFEKKAAELAAFVAKLPEGPRWAVELRHASWWRDETYRLLADAGVTLVWSALGGDARTPPVATTDRLYLRLFGERDLEEPYDRKRRDARAELEHWADAIRTAAPAVMRVEVMVSKYLEGYAPGTAETMAEILGVPLRAPVTRGQTTLM